MRQAAFGCAVLDSRTKGPVEGSGFRASLGFMRNRRRLQAGTSLVCLYPPPPFMLPAVSPKWPDFLGLWLLRKHLNPKLPVLKMPLIYPVSVGTL